MSEQETDTRKLQNVGKGLGVIFTAAAGIAFFNISETQDLITRLVTSGAVGLATSAGSVTTAVAGAFAGDLLGTMLKNQKLARTLAFSGAFAGAVAGCYGGYILSEDYALKKALGQDNEQTTKTSPALTFTSGKAIPLRSIGA